MVNNQVEFNKEYSKGVKEIRIKHRKEFRGDLVIEDYVRLDKLNLWKIKNVEKVVLKNLPQLRECTIWECGVKELVIENCSKIKKMSVHGNLLTGLKFVKDLENLEELEIDKNIEINSGLEHLPNSLKKFSYQNTKLVELVELYKNDWKACQKGIQKLIKQTPYEILRKIQGLRIENQKLKDNQPIAIDNSVEFEKKHKRLKEILNYFCQQEEIKTNELDELHKKEDFDNAANIVTEDLVKGLRNLSENNQKLKKQLEHFENLLQFKKQTIEKKEVELEALKNSLKSKLGEEEDLLDDLLEAQEELARRDSAYVSKQLKKSKNKLGDKLTAEELDNLCQFQAEIIQLKLEIQENFNQVNQTFYVNSKVINQQIKKIQGFNIESSNNTFNNPSVWGNTLEVIPCDEEENSDTDLQKVIEVPLNNKYRK